MDDKTFFEGLCILLIIIATSGIIGYGAGYFHGRMKNNGVNFIKVSRDNCV